MGTLSCGFFCIVSNACVYEPLRLTGLSRAMAVRPATSNGLYTLLGKVHFNIL